MNNWFRNTLVIVIITINGLVIPLNIQAQQLTGAFIISSVGGLNNMSNNSMAVTFSSNATCLNVQNGTAVLTGDRGIGSFAINCEVNPIFNSLGIKLYPNPVVSITKIKFINMPPLNDQFNISIWDADGSRITSGKATGYELFRGMTLDFSMLEAGFYIIQIESDKYTDALKFIKSN
jgi:hypothetical protein